MICEESSLKVTALIESQTSRRLLVELTRKSGHILAGGKEAPAYVLNIEKRCKVSPYLKESQLQARTSCRQAAISSGESRI